MSNIDAIIQVKNVSMTYERPDKEQLKVLCGINLEIIKGEFVGLIGYSGCGKTTLLRIICGFEKAKDGTILFNGQYQYKPSKKMLMLFQGFEQLFPWRTILGNIIHPLVSTGLIKNKMDAKNHALKYISDVELSGFENFYPHELSGGMKQRAAVARALALQPCVLLMDEPFAALDNITRRTLQELTYNVCKKYGITVLFVTHSVEEAVRMASKIVIMNRKGTIEHIINNSLTMKDDSIEHAVFVSDITKIMDTLQY